MQFESIILNTWKWVLVLILTACNSLKNHQQAVVVPTSVEAAFKAKYPQISPAWVKHHYGYEASFIDKNIATEVEFSNTGEWLETEYLVTVKEFPDIIIKRIKKEHPQFIITKYEIEITPQGKFYEVDITDGETESELYFDVNGNPQVDLYED
ncbi:MULTISPECIES: PepSY-like domain-containing protein [Calothrix]|uniref:PepSY-like domain-containing protein n=2 Tax=Calothrix TaxID=1186 RepID=A0ABR8ALS8_9CYAN|nr:MULTISPECIES: PepSY-like domain-containing protein [Calothrix]MBD2200505.1 PepSY-like domain-containing protein [Calothrix parietina FACHB-288]MBD2229522.1 PepSY-like domain-containing protein [Calothrix anomala FACHB-343]